MVGQRLAAHEVTGSFQKSSDREPGHIWQDRRLLTSRQALKPRTVDLRNSEDRSQ